jgi:hypothetical protein
LDNVHTNSINNVGSLIGCGLNTTVENCHTTNGRLVQGGGVGVGGLIGYLENSTVSNSSFSGEISGSFNVGGFVGHLVNSTVTDSNSAVVVRGGNWSIGGFVGRLDSDSVIMRSHSSGSFQTGGPVGVGTPSRSGGFVGISQGTISDSSSSVDIFAYAGRDELGGFVGRLESDGIIKNSSSSGNVSGEHVIGGFVGYSEGEIRYSYSTGDVTVRSQWSIDWNSCFGGFVGAVDSGALISNSFASGDVSGHNNVGGFVGSFNADYFLIEYCYAVGSVSGNDNVGGFTGGAGQGSDAELNSGLIRSSFFRLNNGGGISCYAIPEYSVNLMKMTTFSAEGWSISSAPNADYIWYIEEDAAYPKFYWQYTYVPTITITANSGTFDFDGTEKSVSGLASTVWAGGQPVGATLGGLSASAARTVPGTTEVLVTGTAQVMLGGTDVTANYNIVRTSGELVINSRTDGTGGTDDTRITITVTANSGTFDFDGTEKSVSGFASTVWSDGNPGGAALSGLSANAARAIPGTAEVLVTGTAQVMLGGADVTANYNIVRLPGTLTVNEPDEGSRITITVTADSDTFDFDGTEKVVSGFTAVWAGGQPEGAALSGLSASASRTLPGTTDVFVTGTALIMLDGTDVTANYNIVRTSGELVINSRTDGTGGTDDNRITITATADSGMFDFDGTEKDVSGFTAVWTGGQPVGAVLSGLSANAARTLPGTTDVFVTGTAQVMLDGADVTANYDIIKLPGTLTVNALTDGTGGTDDNRIMITVTADSGTFDFDGTEKSVSSFTVDWSDGNPGGAVLSGLDASASRIAPGTTDVLVTGTAQVMLDGADVTANYDIVKLPGTLTVNALIDGTGGTDDNRIVITVTANSGTFDFDGTEKSVSGFTVEWSDGQPEDAVLSGLDASASRTVPGTTEVLVTGTAEIILDDADVTANYNIIKLPGELIINEPAAGTGGGGSGTGNATIVPPAGDTGYEIDVLSQDESGENGSGVNGSDSNVRGFGGETESSWSGWHFALLLLGAAIGLLLLLFFYRKRKNNKEKAN